MAQGGPAIAHVMGGPGSTSPDLPCREEQRAKDGVPSGRSKIDSWRQVIPCAVEGKGMAHSLSLARRGESRRAPRVGAVQPPQGSSCASPWVWVAWPSIAGQADGRRDPAVQGAIVCGGYARARPWRGGT